MIPWKRTLGWAIGLLTLAALAGAEEPGAAVEAEALEPAAAMEAPAAAGQDVPAEPSAAPEGDAGEPVAEAAPAAPAPEADEPMTEVAPAALAPEAAEPSESADVPAAPALGMVAYDSEGRRGRIHVVVAGDTLWDVSDAYLGTPWVWPSIWKDNDDIADPHVIHPGDRIWITPSEMRRLTAEEAEAMLANGPPAADDLLDVPAALDLDSREAPPATVPQEALTVRVASRETVGMISPEMFESAASVVDRMPERILMSQEDRAYIGLGESEVDVGDEFTLFRVNQKVIDPDNGALLGYHVDVLGWVRVEETAPETSIVSIRMSTGEVEVGDRVMPREPLPPEITVGPSPDGVEGKISFFPQRRVLMGFADFVYLNRGSLDGLEVGSPLEVYRPARAAHESARDERVEVPDHVVGNLLVVRAEEESAVALVTKASRELKLGDHFRGATP